MISHGAAAVALRFPFPVLVCDVGGTNLRVALCRAPGDPPEIVLKDRSSRTPGLFQFRVRGKDDDFQLATENLELVVVLGGLPQAAGGQCGTIGFNPGGSPAPACETAGRTLRCD